MPQAVKSKPDDLHLKGGISNTPPVSILKALPYIFFIATSFFLISKSGAQDSLRNSYTDISKVVLEKKIGRTITSTYIEKNADPGKEYQSLTFIPGLRHTGSIPNEYVTKKIVLKFNICNTADTAVSVYFCPGFYFDNIQLYKIESGNITKLPSALPKIPDSIGYRTITLPGNDSATIMAELSFVKTYNNVVKPRLIHKEHLSSFKASLKSGYIQTDLITYVFCGLLIMMMLFSLTNFLQGANRDFLYYTGYAFFLGGMLLIQTIFHFRSNNFSYFLEGYLDFIFQCIGIIFYMLFMQRFLETRNNHPFLYKLYNAGIAMLTISMLAYSYFHYFTDNYSAENLVENSTKILLLLMIIIFLVYSFRHWKDKLLRYLFWGNLLLFVFALISQLAIFLNPLFNTFPGVFSSAVTYYEIGIFLELVFFLAGLNYKNRRLIIEQTKEREALKAQNQLQEYEKKIAVYKGQQEERARISADMHDELGSGMTAIRLMSEIARNKMKENTPVEIDKISTSADDVLNKMNAIIWSMDSGNDTLDNLISYIRSYALEYLDKTPVQCKINTPDNIPNKELTGDKRRNTFLCVKESLNNILKHAKATLVTINIEANHSLKIEIADNGIGIDLEKIRQFGNGLKNIARRMEVIGGHFKIENKEGTVTTLELPL